MIRPTLAIGILLLAGAGGWAFYSCSWRPRSIERIESASLMIVSEPQTPWRRRATTLAIRDDAALNGIVASLNGDSSGWHPFPQNFESLHYPLFTLSVAQGALLPRRFDIGDYWIVEDRLIKGKPNNVIDLIRATEASPEGAPCPAPSQPLSAADAASVPPWPDARQAGRWCSSERGAPLVFVAECGAEATVIVARDESDGYDAFYYRPNDGRVMGIKRNATTTKMRCAGELPLLAGPCKRLARMDCGATGTDSRGVPAE